MSVSTTDVMVDKERRLEKAEISPMSSPTFTISSSRTVVKSADDDIENQSHHSNLAVHCTWLQRLWASWLRYRQRNSDTEEFCPKVRRLSDCPNGYPRMSAFLDSDDNFMIYRRFGYIQSRLILEKQDELRRLEKALDTQDKEFDEKRPAFVQSRDLPSDLVAKRKALMQELEITFCAYSQLMTAARDLVALNKPAAKDHKSLSNFIFNSTPFTRPDETKWIHCREDLVTLRPGREHAWLDSAIEHLLKWLHCGLVERVFASKETRDKVSGLPEDHGLVVYYTPNRIERLVVGIIVLILIALLIIPIWLLYHLVTQIGIQRTDAICIGILLVFTLAFSAILSLFTRAKRHEILAAAAGYCAVLVVFLGNVNIPNH